MERRILLAAGSNAKGQLGIGSYDDAHTFTPCQFAECPDLGLPPAARVAHAACGANHTVLLLDHGDGSTALWGAGDGRRGQLGPGAQGTTTRFRRLAVRVPNHGYACRLVAAAWETTYVVLSCPERSDVVLAMGSDEFGLLGVGEAGGSSGPDPRVVVLDHIFGDKEVRVQALYAGPRHVVAQVRAADGQTALVGWGACRHGQLGVHAGRFVARPTRLPVDVDADPAVSCALGSRHTVVLHASGRVSVLGSGRVPSLDAGRVCAIGCTWGATYVHVVEGGEGVMLCAGNGVQGQLGGSKVERIVGLEADRAMSGFVCGSEHVLVDMSDSSGGHEVFGWGWNEHGNMGLGSSDNVAVPTQLWPREVEEYKRYPERVIDIWAGCATSWLLVE